MNALALLTAVLLTQAPEPKCISSGGGTVCGYNCREDSGEARCASTPWGVCVAARGSVTCFDPAVWLASVYPVVPPPQCKVASNAACGYNCIVDVNGSAACARTPVGVCYSRNGRTSCFDPPVEVFAVLGAKVPKPECKDDGGDAECGYGCVATNSHVACAATPFGICMARTGQLKCYDPPPAALCAAGERIARPTCSYDVGQLACGYDCKSASGTFACARTPAGRCNTQGPSVTCFDPPAPALDGRCLKLLGTAASQ